MKGGNITKECVFGDLTGKNSVSIQMSDGYPKAKGYECYEILRTYSNDGFNSLLEEKEPSGKRTVYTYVPNRDLPKSKLVYDHKKIVLREFFSYDKNAVLIKKFKITAIVKTRRIYQG